MDRHFVTVHEAARRFGVHIETVRRWIRDDKLAATRIRFGRPGYRIDMTEVERWERELALEAS